MAYEFKLPDIGEGLTEGEIVKWLVKEGDAVRENQPLVHVLTDKAEVEIPSPKTGTIQRLLAKEGEKVAVHSTLVEIAVAGEAGSVKTARQNEDASRKETKAAGGSRPAPSADPASGQVLATPAVRKLAQDLKVDLSFVHATGPGGRLTEEDVRRAANGTAPSPSEAVQGPSTPSHGPEERIPFKGIRRRTAEKMAQSARTIPHVSHFDEADASAMVQARERLKAEAEKKGVKLTFLPFIIQALVAALKEFPQLNASLDEAKEEIALKKHYNIGIAVSAEQGLFVPVLKDADKKDLWTLAKEVVELSAKARENRLALNELQGGTFTITNIGPIGGLFATPIINHPEVGILGIMKIQERPVAREGKVVVRPMLNLALSFDHRVLDGAQAASFMNALIKNLENPR